MTKVSENFLEDQRDLYFQSGRVSITETLQFTSKLSHDNWAHSRP